VHATSWDAADEAAEGSGSGTHFSGSACMRHIDGRRHAVPQAVAVRCARRGRRGDCG